MLAEGDEPHPVRLPQQLVGERGGQSGGVGKLVVAPLVRVAHGTRGVDDHEGAQRGLLLELLDVVAVGFTVGLPVDPTHLVAGGVDLVLGELGRLPLARGTVQPGQHAVGNTAGAQNQAGDGHDRVCG